MAAFKLDKDKLIATSTIIDLGVDFSRTIVYYYNGYMKYKHLYLVTVLVVVGILGTWIGKRILHRMSQDQFRYLVLLLILGVGIASVVSNLNCFG